MIKKFIWLIKNQDKIKEAVTMLEKMEEKPKKKKNYALGGVPDFQKDYVNELLSKQDEIEEV